MRFITSGKSAHVSLRFLSQKAFGFSGAPILDPEHVHLFRQCHTAGKRRQAISPLVYTKGNFFCPKLRCIHFINIRQLYNFPKPYSHKRLGIFYVLTPSPALRCLIAISNAFKRTAYFSGPERFRPNTALALSAFGSCLMFLERNFPSVFLLFFVLFILLSLPIKISYLLVFGPNACFLLLWF